MGKIFVTDLGGVIYSFEPSFDQEKFSQKFNSVVDWYSKNRPEIKDRLEVEKQAVFDSLAGNTGEGVLPIFINQKAVEMLLKNSEKYKIVVISTSRVETSKAILKQAMKEKTEDFISKTDIFDMSEYGSKKDSEAWKKIFEKYKDISLIIEDDEKNLEAAQIAAKQLGFNPVVSKEMILS